jgi:hypothetical protein
LDAAETAIEQLSAADPEPKSLPTLRLELALRRGATDLNEIADGALNADPAGVRRLFADPAIAEVLEKPEFDAIRESVNSSRDRGD